MKERNKIHYSIMVLCFIFAGFCIIQLFYTSFILRRGLEVPFDRINDSFINQTNSSDRNPRDFEMRRVSLPFAIEIFPLFGFIVSLFAGTSLLDLLKKKERKKITKDVMDTILTPEEKEIIRILEENEDGLKQSELVKKSKLSKVKVSRIIKRLENSRIISKYPYGMTNKIILEKIPNGDSEKKSKQGKQSQNPD